MIDVPPPEISEEMSMSDTLQRWRYELCESLRVIKEAVESGNSIQEVRKLASLNGQNTNLHYGHALQFFRKLEGHVDHDTFIALGRLMNFPSSLFVPVDSGELELKSLAPIIEHIIGMLDRNAAIFEEEKLRDLPAIIQGMCEFFDREIVAERSSTTLDILREVQRRLRLDG